MTQHTPTSIRIPDDLRAEVTQTAQEDERSVNRQVLWLVRLGLAARRAAATPVHRATNAHLPEPPAQLLGADHPAGAD